MVCCSSPRSLVNRTNAHVADIDNIRFQIVHRSKSVMDSDTFQKAAEVWLKRIPSDTVLGYHFKVKPNDSTEIHYTGGSWVWINHTQKKATTRVATNKRKPLAGNWAHAFLVSELMDGISLDHLTSNTTLSVGDSLGKHLYYSYAPIADDFVDYVEEWYWIDQETQLPTRYKSQIQALGGVQYTEWLVQAAHINAGSTDSLFAVLEIPDGYEVNEAARPARVEPLPTGAEAPLFNLPSYFEDSVALADLSGKVVLLDFWYIACAPCLKDLPNTQALHEKYKDDGLVVLGMNAADAPQPDKVVQFQKEHGYTFNTLVTSIQFDQSYRVQGYPTKYVIGPDQAIAFSERGWHSPPTMAVDSAVQSLIGR